MTIAVLVLSLLVQDADEQARSAVKEFQKAYGAKGATDGDRASAVKQLAKVKHKRTLAALSTSLFDPKDKIRETTAKAIGTFKDIKGAASILLKALKHPSNKKRDDVKRAIVQALGEVGDKKTLPAFYELYDKKPFGLAKDAVIASGKIPHKATIPKLIKLFELADRDADSVGNIEGMDEYLPEDTPGVGDGDGPGSGLPSTGGAGGGGTAEAEARKEQAERRRVLAGPIRDTLVKLTGERFNRPEEWVKWWKKNAATFKIKS